MSQVLSGERAHIPLAHSLEIVVEKYLADFADHPAAEDLPEVVEVLCLFEEMLLGEEQELGWDSERE